MVYTYKVNRSNSDDTIVGYLSLCFKFENEMDSIFNHIINKQNKEVLLLLDSNSQVISTSDKYQIPLEAKLEIEIYNEYKVTQFAGRDYIVKTCQTNGYEGFYGLGWLGHIMIPLESVFNITTKPLNIEQNILEIIMKNDKLFDRKLLDIPAKAEYIQNELNRAVWNGNINQKENSKLTNSDFARSILREVKLTGEKTQTMFNTSIENLNQTIISSLLEKVTFISSLSIDIMDRNLYERANDCRWWALTTTFREVLSSKNIAEEQKKELSNILEYINELYTVYTNIFIYDENGKVLAVSNPQEQKLVGRQLTNSWIKQTLNLTDSLKYSVSNFEKTYLYNNNHTYIYGASIARLNNSKSVGGIGIVFDAKDQFQDMLKDALPKNDGEIQKGVFSLFVEKDTKRIISCSDNSHTIGDILNIDSDFFKLSNSETLSKIISYENKYYMVGVCCSSGYREYKSESDDYKNDLISIVFIEAGEIVSNKLCEVKFKKDNYYKYHILANEESVEIATFYIENRWLGIKASDIIESVSIQNLEDAISMDINHHFKGTASYGNYIVSVLDISSFIQNTLHSENKNDIVIVKYEDSFNENHTIGIVVEKLGEIVKIPLKSIKKLENHLIGGGILAQSIVNPPENSTTKSLLTILNISKISTLKD